MNANESTDEKRLPQRIVVGGPSGAGKSTVAQALATRLGYVFHDGDDHHSADNRAKMNAGIPLTDEDRLPWLEKLATLADDIPFGSNQPTTKAGAPRGVVIACSALRRCYRTILICGRPSTDCRIVMLRLPEDVLAERLSARHNHFFNSCLLSSQMSALELPEAALSDERPATSQTDIEEPHLLVVDGNRPVVAIIDTIVDQLTK